jgi:hypothetical protein
MTFDFAVHTITVLHVTVSVVGIAAGFIVLNGMWNARIPPASAPKWTFDWEAGGHIPAAPRRSIRRFSSRVPRGPTPRYAPVHI